jgi:hypothetical protein
MFFHENYNCIEKLDLSCIRGCFKMSCSEKFYIAVTQFQNFETSLAGILKQAILRHIQKNN